MQTKALVLAAFPPFEGPWIPLREGQWKAIAETRPADFDLDGQVLIEVEGSAGGHLCKLGEVFEGRAVRAVLREEVEGVELISVFIEEGM